jgi:hypothetical protein
MDEGEGDVLSVHQVFTNEQRWTATAVPVDMPMLPGNSRMASEMGRIAQSLQCGILSVCTERFPTQPTTQSRTPTTD